MGLLILGICFVIEMAFLIFTIVKKTDKKSWLFQRFYINAGEIVIYLLMILLPGVDFSFRFMGLFILLLIRAAIAGIVVLIEHRKATGQRSIVKLVIGVVLSTALIAVSLIPSFLITDYQGLKTSGAYEVAEARAILMDQSRAETFETDGSCREIPIYFYYPADAKEGEQFPLVLFSHGAFGYYQSNTSTYMELASNGYVVVSMDHPYHSFFTEDTDGKMITVNQEFLGSVYYANESTTSDEEIVTQFKEWLAIRTADINCILDTLIQTSDGQTLSDAWFLKETDENTILSILSIVNYDKIGLIGHSLGGAASVRVGRERDDIDAVIDLDGTMDGELLSYDYSKMIELEGNSYPTPIFVEGAYPVPILSVDNEEHHEVYETVNKNYANYVVIENAVDGQETYIVGSGHMNFTDLPLFSPILASKLGTGTVDELHCIETTNYLVLGFFNQHLKDGETFIIQESYE